jgi:large subunit ribosomal protein L10
MSKRIKGLIETDIKNRLKDATGVAVLSPAGVDGNANNSLRRKLHEKGSRMLVVKNTLARRATSGTALQGFEKLLNGPSALIFGEASMPVVARLLMEEKKNNAKLELRGVFFEGEIYEGEAGVDFASKLPTREEAIANVVAAVLSPGKKLGGIFKGQAGKVAALIKSVEEKAKEKEAAPA